MAYKDISDKSYVEIIAAVLVESGIKFVSTRDIYSGLCSKWTPFQDMTDIEWNSVIDRILQQNPCFLHDSRSHWRLHPACMMLVRDGVYKADAMNNCAKMRCSFASREAALASIATTRSKKRSHQLPMDHQHSTKKMKLSVDAITIRQDEPSVFGNYVISKVENTTDIKPSVGILVPREPKECPVHGNFTDRVKQEIKVEEHHVDNEDEDIPATPDVINIEPIVWFFAR